jgi:hypothetical protein
MTPRGHASAPAPAMARPCPTHTEAHQERGREARAARGEAEGIAAVCGGRGRWCAVTSGEREREARGRG